MKRTAGAPGVPPGSRGVRRTMEQSRRLLGNTRRSVPAPSEPAPSPRAVKSLVVRGAGRHPPPSRPPSQERDRHPLRQGLPAGDLGRLPRALEGRRGPVPGRRLLVVRRPVRWARRTRVREPAHLGSGSAPVQGRRRVRFLPPCGCPRQRAEGPHTGGREGGLPHGRRGHIVAAAGSTATGFIRVPPSRTLRVLR